MLNKDLEMFKATGFFDEKPIAIQHLKDFSEILNKHDINYCVMFGVLLGMLRHQDFIPGMTISILLFSIMRNFSIDVSRNWKREDMLFRRISGMRKIAVVVFFITAIRNRG